jgi:hypothetical protein
VVVHHGGEVADVACGGVEFGADGPDLLVDGTPDTVPDSTAETTGTSYTTTRSEGTWYLHVRGIDGNGTGGATSHYRFTADTTVPGAPDVTSAAYPTNAWAGGAQVTGTFTLTPDGTDTRSLTYKIDGGTAQTVTTTGGPVALPITPPVRAAISSSSPRPTGPATTPPRPSGPCTSDGRP